MLSRLRQLRWVRALVITLLCLGLVWAALWVVFLVLVAPGLFGP